MKLETKESCVRSRARRRGYRVLKSRGSVSLDNFGDYQLVDSNNWIVMGSRFDATLADIDGFLAD